MGLRFRIMKLLLGRFGVPRVRKILEKQRSLSEMPGIIHPTDFSPTRFEIPLEAMKLIQERNDIEMKQIFPLRRLLSNMKNIHLSVDSIAENPPCTKREITEEFLTQLKEFATSLGVGNIAFVKLPHNLIFQKVGVLYDNAIVLTMEMSKEKLDQAPSQATLNMVFRTYDDLGKAANKVAKFLRIHGYAAQADHPLGGLVLFPPLAQKAGIGWVGRHGLLITPEFGPRVRLAAVYTPIENLPLSNSNEHGWISDYCNTCGICIKKCPARAILEDTIIHESGQMTYVKQRECFEYFVQYYGCSVCIKVCPFSRTMRAYEQLKAAMEKR
jgi:epoxyqueuosine reductase